MHSPFLCRMLSNALVACTFVLCVTTAEATYAGKNGRIAFVSNISGTYQLYSIKPDGSDMIPITDLPPTDNALWFPDYSPDGRRIVFSHDMTGALEMYVINSDGTGLTQITHDGLVDIFARWSPDGKHFVFLSTSLKNGAGVITTMRTDGSNRKVLTDEIPFDSYQPEYTPDGRQIVFASQQGGLISAVWIMNADGSGKRRLTDAPIEAGGPDVSPDGRTLAFYSHQNTPKPTTIWVMNVDGSQKRRLTPLGLFDVYPIYSPDGKRILFQGGPLTSPINLYTMNVDGSAVRPVVANLIIGGCPDGNCISPDWGAEP